MGKKTKDTREAPRPKEKRPDFPAARKAPRPKEDRPKQKGSEQRQTNERARE